MNKYIKIYYCKTFMDRQNINYFSYN